MRLDLPTTPLQAGDIEAACKKEAAPQALLRTCFHMFFILSSAGVACLMATAPLCCQCSHVPHKMALLKCSASAKPCCILSPSTALRWPKMLQVPVAAHGKPFLGAIQEDAGSLLLCKAQGRPPAQAASSRNYSAQRQRFEQIPI